MLNKSGIFPWGRCCFFYAKKRMKKTEKMELKRGNEAGNML